MGREVYETDKFVFFWNGIYSQWYPSQFTIDGIKFSSCEQYMMYRKAKLFNDDESAQKILDAVHPSDQKALGRGVKNFNRDIWDEHCFSIVYDGNYAKFTQNEDLKQQLLATGDKTIVEASPYDKIWGIKKGVGDENYDNPSHWRGLNLLGFAIMTVRKNIQ
jgi:ribA/ribD-fused uncharacterized protein